MALSATEVFMGLFDAKKTLKYENYRKEAGVSAGAKAGLKAPL